MHNIISVVTPSYNQAEFIADTIKSILSQEGDFYIDYVIVDGASSDGSQKIIANFEAELKANCVIEKHHGLEFYVAKKGFGLNRCKGISYRWMSEKDNGHAHALNKGFALTKGDIMCWLNSDDMYHEKAFQTVNEVFSQFSQVKWITGLNSIWNKDGSQLQVSYLGKHNYKNVYSFLTNDYEWIQQETTFWHRDLWTKSGSRINTDYKFMVDGELWCRFFLHEEIFHLNRELGGYRKHDSNRAHKHMDKVKVELDRAVRILESKIGQEIRKIARSISDNAPSEDLDYRNVNFKVIDKTKHDQCWIISEVDFFQYSLKRSAARIRSFQHIVAGYANTENEKADKIKTLLNEKELLINQILNSKRYKLGSLLLSPIKPLVIVSKGILAAFTNFNKLIRSHSLMRSWKRILYPMGLNWRKITLPDKYIFESNKQYNAFLKRALNAVLKSRPEIPFSVNTNMLFIKSMIRSDYNDFYQNVRIQCNGTNVLVDITYKDFQERKVAMIFKIVWYFPIFILLFNFNWKVSVYRYLRAILYLSVLKIMRHYKFNTLISFADMQGVENMLVQYFRKKGKTTVTLQHGLYVDYSTFDNINRVNYENVVSHYFLAWGNETKELIKRYHPSVNVIVCGKPLYFKNTQGKGNYFTLVFDQFLFIQQNKELLVIASLIAKHYNISVNVRLHPWDLRKRYEFENDITLFDEDIAASKFVIGHTTSMVFECMRNGIPAFKYKTKYPSNVVSDDLTFTNAEELIQRIQHIDKYNFTELGKYYLEYVGDESLQQYASFFNSLQKQSSLTINQS